MKPEIEKAIHEIRTAFGSEIEIKPDPEGGAFVKVLDLDLGRQYQPDRSWVAFRITFQYPFADVYPHFVVPELRRKDGVELKPPFHPANQFWTPPGEQQQPAVMVSRRSNKRDASVDTAAFKLQRVLEWLRSQ